MISSEFHHNNVDAMFVDNKIWETVAAAKLEADEVMARMADNIYFTSPESRGVQPEQQK
jgi:hypothetical protein